MSWQTAGPAPYIAGPLQPHSNAPVNMGYSGGGGGGGMGGGPGPGPAMGMGMGMNMPMGGQMGMGGMPPMGGMGGMPGMAGMGMGGPGGAWPIPVDVGNKTSLWMGELDSWMDENFIRQTWSTVLGENVSVKMIRDKFTGIPAGYCFVDFMSPASAYKALSTFSGAIIPGSNRTFKLNWASGGGMSEPRAGRPQGSGVIGGNGGAGSDGVVEYSIFVGDLSSEVTDFMLQALFQASYSSVRSAKVVTDPATGMPRGYGFVRFTDEAEQQRALTAMQGVYCGSRPMRISMATPKSHPHGGRTNPPSSTGMAQAVQFADPSNTTIFIGGLVAPISDDELHSYFVPFGEVTHVKIPPGKGCGFVQFSHRQSAELAIGKMNGYSLNGSRLRLSWGKSPADKGGGGTSYRGHVAGVMSPGGPSFAPSGPGPYPTAGSSFSHVYHQPHHQVPPHPSSHSPAMMTSMPMGGMTGMHGMSHEPHHQEYAGGHSMNGGYLEDMERNLDQTHAGAVN